MGVCRSPPSLVVLCSAAKTSAPFFSSCEWHAHTFIVFFLVRARPLALTCAVSFWCVSRAFSSLPGHVRNNLFFYKQNKKKERRSDCVVKSIERLENQGVGPQRAVPCFGQVVARARSRTVRRSILRRTWTSPSPSAGSSGEYPASTSTRAMSTTRSGH